MPFWSLKLFLRRNRKDSVHKNSSEIERIFEQICQGVNYAHRQGVIHLDLKPSNILFDENDSVLVADFGLAKMLQGATHAKADTNAGTTSYMPPEQWVGGDVRPFSDVYALGMTLHEMLTGQVPRRQWNSGHLSVTIAKSLDERIAAVMKKATMSDSQQRYLTVDELRYEFKRAMHPSSMSTLTPIIPERSTSLREVSSSSPALLPTNPSQNLDKVLLALKDLGEFCEANPNINERELVTYTFKPDGLFATLGYDELVRKVSLEYQQADVILRAFNGRPLAVVEFKRPNRSPNEGLDQLETRYVAKLLPDVGVLCNGRELWIYRRAGTRLYRPPVLRLTLKDANRDDAQAVYNWLSWRKIDLTQLEKFEKILLSLARNPISVSDPSEAGGRAFIDRFALSHFTPFGRLVEAMAQILPDMLKVSSFTRGAYAFWRRIYAREMAFKDIPQTWKDLMDVRDQDSLYYLVFALESAYSFLSRLLLMRAMENHKFPHFTPTDTFIGSLKPLRKYDKLASDAYATALKYTFKYSGQHAFQTLFDSDIFDWWHDIGKSPPALPVGERLAEAVLTVFEFDFEPMSGDLLGSLYQSYFDPETRKALGEFYTPPEVVDFILDEIGYTTNTVSLSSKRLLDPACGSGTFLVHALQRYLKANQRRSASEVLPELLGGLKIVGFDVNPFAVLMSKANYAAQIIPLYAKVLQEGGLPPTFSIPVLRTDSLRQEYREGDISEGRPNEVTQGFLFSQDENVTLIHAELPVEVSPGKFFSTDIPVPRYSKARNEGWVHNPEEYFAALRILFEAVDAQENNVLDLKKRLLDGGLKPDKGLAEYMQPAVSQLITEMQRLREQYSDGRFLRTLADLALALVLKNDVRYHYVVGNPPYIRIQSIPELLRSKWETWYHWSSGNFDAYMPFLERSIFLCPQSTGPNLHEWLAPGGVLGFICPNRFLVANYAEGMRTSLPTKAAVNLIFDFRDSRVFGDALNYPVIFVAKRLEENESLPTAFPVIRVFEDARKGPIQLLTEARQLLETIRAGKEYIQGEVADAFQVDINNLRRSAWLLMPTSEQRVFEKLEKAATSEYFENCPVCKNLPQKEQVHRTHVIRLQDLTTTSSGAFQGIATGDDGILVFRLLEDHGDTLLLRPKGAGGPEWQGPSEVEIERKVLRPWLFGRDVTRWYINWDHWYVFFPYDVIEAEERKKGSWIPSSRYRLIPTSKYINDFKKKLRYVGDYPTLDKNYPLAWAYVKHPLIEERLRARESRRRAMGTQEQHVWYELGRPQNLELFNLPKLLMQISSTHPDFAFDEDEHFLLQHGGRGGGTDGIVLNSSVGHWFMLALLNSAPIDFYLKHISTVFSGKAYSYSDAFIKQLPIKLPLNQDEFIQSEQIGKLAQQLANIKDRLETKKEERGCFPAPQCRSLSIKYDLYPLKASIQGIPKSQSFKRSEVNVDQRTLDGGIAMQFGKSLLTLPHIWMAKVVEAWLRLQPKENLHTEDLLSIAISQDPEACQQLLKALGTLEEDVNMLQMELSEGEKTLNDLISNYYSLDVDDCCIITDFLNRFGSCNLLS